MEKPQEDVRALALLSRVLEDARSLGAVAAEALVVTSQSCTLQWKGGRRTQPQRGAELRLSGYVYLDGGKRGSFSVNSDGRDAQHEALQAAVAAAKSAPTNAEAGPADRYNIATRGLGIDDPRYHIITDEDRREVITFNEETCSKVEGIECQSVRYGDLRRLRAFASSRGVEVVSVETRYDVSVDARDKVTGLMLGQTASARHFANVGSLPYGSELGNRLASLRQRVQLPPGDPAIVLESRAMATILSAFTRAFSAPLLHAGKSFLTQHLKRPIGHARVHLVDDAGLHGGLLTRAFDDRGVPPVPVPIIREGYLGGLFHDPESARLDSTRPTGHVLDGQIQPSNLVLRAGNRSRTQMLGEVPLALAFDHISGTLDLATGLLEMQGPAIVMERGHHVGAVVKAVLRGHISELLRAVVEVASDQERYSAVDCATTLIKGFPVSAS